MTSFLKYLSFGSLALLVVVLVCSSVGGKFFGATFAAGYFYSAGWFVVLWGVLLVSALCYLFKSAVRGASLFLHVAFAVVLVGAFVTYLTAERGSLLLTQGAVPASMFEREDGALVKMPFKVQLDDFDVVYYPDGFSPKDYVATLVVERADGVVERVAVSMNSIYSYDGCCLYIGGYTGDVVSMLVACDRWGTAVTYAGYLLLLASIVWLFVGKHSGFRRLLSECDFGSPICLNSGFWAKGARALLFLLFLYLSACGISRFVATGIFPASNAHEALLLMSWSAALLALLFFNRKPFMLVALSLVAVLSFFVAEFFIGGSSSPVAPILRAPLLGLHVATIILSYTLIACAAVNAIVALFFHCRGGRVQLVGRMAAVGRLLLYPATMLLVVGIFFGAVWANISWGRYWGWDPKEVWALITLLLCSLPFHTRSLPFMARPLFFHVFCIVAFLAVLFTYFGVNYFLGGLHSYA